jgi:SAM-dependent methyltransferase
LLKLVSPASPFDSVAGEYDAAFTETATGRLQRERVWAFLTQLLHQRSPHVQVIEFNCGTGEDALWLARQGCQVLATDVSRQMLAVTQQKVQAAGLEDSITPQQLDLVAVERFIRENQFQSASSAFHIVFSNFGGLNCLSPADLQRLGKYLPALLSPGGYFVAVVMGRFCWQESLYFLLKGQMRNAFRRLRREPVAARLDEQTTVDTWYYSPRTFRRFFPDLEMGTLQPVGFWLPPSYLDPRFRRRPQLLQVLNRLERLCRGRFWAWGADHFLICLKKPGP